MARDEVAMDTAEWTFCFEKTSNVRFDESAGSGTKAVSMLPWVLVRFNNPGDGRDFIMPLPPFAIPMGSGIDDALAGLYGPVEGGTVLHYRFGKAYMQFMPNQPFPLDNAGPANFSGNPGGFLGIHYFGGA